MKIFKGLSLSVNVFPRSETLNEWPATLKERLRQFFVCIGGSVLLTKTKESQKVGETARRPDKGDAKRGQGPRPSSGKDFTWCSKYSSSVGKR